MLNQKFTFFLENLVIYNNSHLTTIDSGRFALVTTQDGCSWLYLIIQLHVCL